MVIGSSRSLRLTHSTIEANECHGANPSTVNKTRLKINLWQVWRIDLILFLPFACSPRTKWLISRTHFCYTTASNAVEWRQNIDTYTVRINSNIFIRYWRRFRPTGDAPNHATRADICAEVGKKGARPQIDCKHNAKKQKYLSTRIRMLCSFASQCLLFIVSSQLHIYFVIIFACMQQQPVSVALFETHMDRMRTQTHAPNDKCAITLWH